MERTLRRISPGSVFKVSFVIYAILTAVFGCLFLLLPGLLMGGAMLPFLDSNDAVGAMLGGTAGLLVFYVLLVIVGALLEGIIMAIAALIYNLVAGWVGGIRYEVQE